MVTIISKKDLNDILKCSKITLAHISGVPIEEVPDNHLLIMKGYTIIFPVSLTRPDEVLGKYQLK